MKKAIIYIHGKNGSATEADHYKTMFRDASVIGFDYKSNTPWDAQVEFSTFFDSVKTNYSSISIIANSIGAFFVMSSLQAKEIEKAYFISPIVDMEKLILDMMQWSNISEDKLKTKKEIVTNFGETLSWDYLTYVRTHPIKWTIPTHILYGNNDNLTSKDTITRFAQYHNTTLTIMENGEHWFHTTEQMNFLDMWLIKFYK